jgi:hypothetical protein
LNDLIGVAGFATVQLLSKESDGSLTVFIEGRPRSGWHKPSIQQGVQLSALRAVRGRVADDISGKRRSSPEDPGVLTEEVCITE